ncbi:hypothetical protein Xish_03707 [Xenorhabdus ishibashii]|uniref:Uncharacterized protein n=1 Tax=Xenorhabdus ishibashii TaxID=1034471 RepID=A0A2D0K6P7_9GAMM|nr:hypothetical protein Xish_03707 [Xenorhabdus ishibashii]
MVATASLITVTAFITAGKPSAVDGETCSPDLVLDIPARERNSSILTLRVSAALRLKGHIVTPRTVAASNDANQHC